MGLRCPPAAPSPTDVSLEPCRCRHPPCAWRAPWPHSSCGEGGTALAAPPRGCVLPPGLCAPPGAVCPLPSAQGAVGLTARRSATGRWSEREAIWVMKEKLSTSCRESSGCWGGGTRWDPPAVPPRHSPPAAAGCRGMAGTARSLCAAPARRHRPRGRAARWTGWGPPGTAAGPRAARASWGGTGVRGGPRVPQLECTGAQ